MRLIQGSIVRRLATERCQPYREHFIGKEIWIIRFLPTTGEKNPLLLAKYEAARYSSEAKQKSFENIGCSVKNLALPNNFGNEDFIEMLSRASADPKTVGIIVQNPIPVPLQMTIEILPIHLDLDGLQTDHPLFKTSATAETIARLVEEFAKPDHTVVVVGSQGFVGSGVLKLLEEQGIQHFGLDIGDDLLRTRDASIIVSTTGVPGVLDERHILSKHELVVDAGFVPLEGKILGDIAPSAKDIPQRLTPVPGGVGPMQMATLLERLLQAQGLNFEPWNYRSAVIQEQNRQSQQKRGGLEL
jgi:methylenetetrahydrofolate dehydrogenase (NADP+) / methenyltetrahydrofolate cyclohydrolase